MTEVGRRAPPGSRRRPAPQVPNRQDPAATTAIVAATIPSVPDALETRHVDINPYKTMVYNLLGRMVRSLLDVTVHDGYRAPADFLYRLLHSVGGHVTLGTRGVATVQTFLS